MPRRRFEERIPLEREVEPLDQYGRPWGERTLRQEESYSKAIGKFFIVFSTLETALDHMIITAISDRADEEGYRIIKYLEFRHKINLGKDEYQRRISFISNQKLKASLQSKLNLIIRKLEEISEFRNKIAHANWESLSDAGFVRVRIKEDTTGAGIHFVRIKMTPLIIGEFIRQAAALANRVDSFSETALVCGVKGKYSFPRRTRRPTIVNSNPNYRHLLLQNDLKRGML